jgi:lipopolysaccharide biosynthesis glycosyltransferase
MTEVSIALAANHRYLPGLLATMTSMIIHASDRKRLRFYIFADGLEETDKAKVVETASKFGCEDSVIFHHPDMGLIKRLFKPYRGAHSAFLRLFLCEFLPFDWVLYSDVDTLGLTMCAPFGMSGMRMCRCCGVRIVLQSLEG